MSNPKSLYDDSSLDSILDRALLLKDRSLREELTAPQIAEILCYPDNAGKGKVGQLVELFHFGIATNSLAQPDFQKVSVELKTTPLKRTASGLRSKERLVLNIIDYEKENISNFEASSFWKKNRLLLLMFFLWIKDQHPIDHVFKDIKYWDFASKYKDLEIIRGDWEIIAKKIAENRAHELSEGDTNYLGACTKGATAESSYRRQRRSGAPPAKQRAYSLKSKYVNMMLDPALLSGMEPIIKVPEELKTKSFEEIVIERFATLYGKNVDYIVNAVGADDLNPDAKNFYANLTNVVLGISPSKQAEEFEKADITVRTVRLKPDGLPKESVSFPHFDFLKIVDERWETSDFLAELERRFFFVFYKYTGNQLFLQRVKFWTMPAEDIENAKRVWSKTRELLLAGRIVSRVTRTGIRHTHFPSSTENPVGHVRPHGRDRDDMLPLPVPDRLTGMPNYTKQSFWLNAAYIKNQIARY